MLLANDSLSRHQAIPSPAPLGPRSPYTRTLQQAKNPGRVIAVPPAFVSEVLDCLEDIACNAIRVPRSLEESVKYSLEVVAGPDVDTAGAAFLCYRGGPYGKRSVEGVRTDGGGGWNV